jgi:hypothetical protein
MTCPTWGCYNVSQGAGNLSSKSDIVGLFDWVNAASANMFIPMLLLTVWIIGFITFNRNSTPQDAAIGSTFVVFLLSALFYAAGVLDGVVVMLLLFAMGLLVVIRR